MNRQAQAANERANNYVGALVLFASSLFFAGIAIKLRAAARELPILGMGCADVRRHRDLAGDAAPGVAAEG